MKPLVTILVIMLAVVYNESHHQHVTDHQDDYQNVFKESSREFCDPVVQRKLCEISVQRRNIFNDGNALDYTVEDSPENIDLFSEEFFKKFSQKRGGFDPYNRKSDLNCEVEKKHVTLPSSDYFPNVLANISCKYTNKDKNPDDERICLEGSNCQPVIAKVRVLKRKRHLENLPQHYRPHHHTQYELPLELRDCWEYAYVPIEVGCRCYRLN